MFMLDEVEEYEKQREKELAREIEIERQKEIELGKERERELERQMNGEDTASTYSTSYTAESPESTSANTSSQYDAGSYSSFSFDSYLMDGESVIWKGEGTGGGLSSIGQIQKVKIIIYFWFGGTLLFALISAIAEPLSIIFKLPIIAIGFYIIKMLKRKPKPSYYALTNFRALFYKNGTFTEKKLEEVDDIQVQTLAKNKGSIIFNNFLKNVELQNGRVNVGNFINTQTGFVGISDTQYVYKLFTQAVADRKEELKGEEQ